MIEKLEMMDVRGLWEEIKDTTDWKELDTVQRLQGYSNKHESDYVYYLVTYDDGEQCLYRQKR